MIKSKMSILLSLPFLFCSCGTTTRLGDVLIPAHPLSNARSAERVELVVGVGQSLKEVKEESTQEGGVKPQVALGGPVAAFLASQAIGFAKREIEGEAKKYNAQYGRKIRHGFKVGYRYPVTLSRFVGNKLASEFTFNLETRNFVGASGIAIVALDLEEVEIKRSKAKVVGWSGKPWTWLGGALLKTGNQVTVGTQVVMRGVTQKGAVTVLDTMFPNSGQTIKLGKSQRGSAPVGDYAIAGKSGEFVFLSLEVLITESDTSNVKELLEQAADSLEEQEGALTQLIGGLIN